jgi:transposase
MTVKTDRNDAQGIAQIVRTGWFKAVHLKSAAGQRLRTLTAARKAAVRAVTSNEQAIRGLLRPPGLKIGAVTRVGFEARVRQLIDSDRLLLGKRRPQATALSASVSA